MMQQGRGRLQELVQSSFYLTVIVVQPFKAQEDTAVPFLRNFNSILRRDHQKNFL